MMILIALSRVQLFMTPRTAAYQSPLSMGFSRQESWSGVPLPSLDQPREHIKKEKHYFADKGPSSQAMVFPVVMYGCEIWTKRKVEHRRTDAFELWCWRRFLRVPWTARRSNQSILKEISPEFSLEGQMLNLKLQYFGHLMQRAESLEKTWMLGKIEGSSRREWQKMR